MRTSGRATRRWSGRLATLIALLASPPAFAGWNSTEEMIFEPLHVDLHARHHPQQRQARPAGWPYTAATRPTTI